MKREKRQNKDEKGRIGYLFTYILNNALICVVSLSKNIILSG
jgi:hypothetical protein